MAVKVETHPAPTPEPGTASELIPGLIWLRMPLPFELEHINLWLIDNGSGWVAVDTGIASSKTQDIWARVIDEWLDGKPIERLLVTHMHPDHVGSAGWLCNRFGIELEMTRTEYLMCRNLVNDPFQQPPPEAIRFYSAAGWNEQALAEYSKRFGGFGSAVKHLPNGYRRLEEGDTLVIGNKSWEVVVGCGHSPEHACFLEPDSNILISGDQILPSISSNVSVWPTEPDANPLGDWLRSCRELIDRLPEDVLVLPAHGTPFVGAHARLRSLIRGHESGLERLLEACGEPRQVVDLLSVLFKRTLSGENWLMATGECIAHLNYLLAEGQLTRWRTDEGIDLYQRS